MFATIGDDKDALLTGQESYPIEGSLAFSEDVYRVWKNEFKGLNRYWDCLPKAQKVQRFFGGVVVLGRLFVTSANYTSQYGYEFNPPYEFHAWVRFASGILDFALPGVIEKGLNTVDDIGPFLIGREPFILVGKPLNWLHYRQEVIVE
jgi:hypothetical protein